MHEHVRSAGASGTTSSLDPLETKPQCATRAWGWQDRIHSRWAATRRRVIGALGRSADHRLQTRSLRISGCCSWPVGLILSDGTPGISLGRCRDRMCGLCAHRRSLEAADRIGAIAQRMSSPRLITLTLRASDAPLADQVARLVDAFRDLRRRKVWGQHVRGGVATLEITRSAATGRWHPHLHTLVDGSYFPHELLRRAWLDLTGDSYIVDVRAVHDRSQATRYIAKYCGKPANFGSWPDDAIAHYALAMHGRRTIITFGASHSVTVDPRDSGDRPKASRVLHSLVHVLRHAAAGDPEQQRVVRALPSLGSTWCRWLGVSADREFVVDHERLLHAATVLEHAVWRATDWLARGQPPYEPPPIRLPEHPPTSGLWPPPHP